MRPDVPRRWVRLIIESNGQNFDLRAEFHIDSTIEITRDPDELHRFDRTTNFLLPDFVIRHSSGLRGEIEAAARAMASFTHEGSGEPATLPVFVLPPRGLEAMPWRRPIRDIVGEIDNVEIVLEWHTSSDPIPPLTLPLTLAISPSLGALQAELESSSSWFRSAARSVLTASWTDEPGARGVNVAIVSSQDLDLFDAIPAPTLTILLSSEGPRRRRLLIGPRGRPFLLRPSTPARSTVHMNSSDTDGVVELLEALSHDLPLHEAVHLLGRDRARLTSSPVAVHDLRLRDAVDAMIVRMHDLETHYGRESFDTSRWSADPVWSEGFGTIEHRISFDRESNGLFPLTRWSRQFNVTESLLADDPERQDGTRVVDIAWRRGADVAPAEFGPFVGMTCALQAGATYYLRLRIGNRSRSSIVDGPVQPIDHLLPRSDDGHAIEFVVFAGRFHLEGSASQTVRLPTTGPSDVCEFPLVAPSTTGEATVRVGFYHELNLLQTFLVTTTIAEHEQAGVADHALVARQDHVSTTSWDDLDELGSRQLSIVLNMSETHQMYVVGHNEPPVEWSLPDNFQLAYAQPIRTQLANYVSGTSNNETVLRSLASLGHSLSNRLLERAGGGTDGRAVLRDLASGPDDQLIQIVRADALQSIPWNVVYDWKPPADGASVCWGNVGADSCSHQRGDNVVCVRGFWGVRHRVEELIGSAKSAATGLVAQGPLPSIDFALGVDVNTSITNLRNYLDAHFTVTALASADSLLERLWSHQRSPITVLVGHYDEKAQAIVCGTSESPLTADAITDFAFDRGDLEVPGPLLLMMVCDSLALTPETIASQALSFTAARVAAIVGTECIVRTSDIELFSTGLMTSLLGTSGPAPAAPAPLASAMQSARRSMIRTGRMSALAFVAFGSSQLTLEV